MKSWRQKLVVLVLLLVPLQALAASVSAFNCHADASHQATADARTDAHGASQALHTHDDGASHQHEGDPGSDHAGFFNCHHLFSGMPADVIASVPAEPPEFISSLSLLFTLFVPERPQRPPRT